MEKLYAIPYYPVGSILEFGREMDMTSIYGGTWELFGAGRVTIGVDENDADFDQALKTGGDKTHTQTADEIAPHAHTGKTGKAMVMSSIMRVVSGDYDTADNKNGNHMAATPHKDIRYYDAANNTSDFPGATHYHDVNINNTGNGAPMNIINPYIVVYRYRKTADD